MPCPNCRCVLFSILPPVKEIDLKLESIKFEAQLMLANPRTDRVVIPTRDEMIGFYLLERDDELPRRKC